MRGALSREGFPSAQVVVKTRDRTSSGCGRDLGCGAVEAEGNMNHLRAAIFAALDPNGDLVSFLPPPSRMLRGS